jgi:hypothetical protein
MPRKKTIKVAALLKPMLKKRLLVELSKNRGATRTDIAFCGRASRLTGLRAPQWYENTTG